MAKKKTAPKKKKDSTTAPPQATAIARETTQRRPLVLAALFTALVVFIVLLPPSQRLGLWFALFNRRDLLAVLTVFGLVSLSLLWTQGQELDKRAFLFFNLWGKRPAWADNIMWIFTQIGNGGTATAIAIIAYFLGLRDFGVELVFGTLTLWLAVETMKLITNRTRPFKAIEQARVIGHRERGRSFPSGHTAQAFFMMSVIVSELQPHALVVLLLYGLAIVVGVTRMYVGAHYPRDVIGGTVLGILWGIGTSLLDPVGLFSFPFVR
jgi:membrane-associated phospholipid phosphatase